ncbi:hypothetical protein A3D42_01390 [Candidatus Nomurabacteria bacterium RIFCSPHIGHO2_02_FULL_41_18]|uniref:DNA 3'-5' helicase n=1 Tax=Candidatus Nomurabacteria bacterium RIFCSPHIGHO2_02_FULL_41_18 TaxID=1801754 RepID=A0A1F6W7F4_9BACT|nr:MAG: hypothetical protein A2737_00135 [Candidatus Nomurabacteria bacterium RIFCSPHIGHO2_01_FULL_41_71]OGI77848.1 MAG: hypothetical protein A3D42_01390 [Candidatus Nomurabacteria bacterium RIFCSPHIGHO2_02_FULL_41_18]OGI89998.1 MAG: hypothetical protein A3B01_02040 [Candidatus Nomurabacteria bacterium RIFCSPLOWO2_01_FULL_41_52b]
MNNKTFETEYKKLNSRQKEAVDWIEGPVMVVAGPGTGKTQVLALRIGNILKKTDTKSDSILCLTFTNSAVASMRERLRRYIGSEASKVKVATFHSFGMDMLGKYFQALGLREEPKLLDEKDAVSLFDDILYENDWEHIRPRSDSSRYFRDLRSLISILKREGISPEDFKKEIKSEIEFVSKDPSSLSSRGERKGELKKDAERKIESLRRSLEAAKFYYVYEEKKKEKNLFDYDDILKSLVSIVRESEEAAEEMRLNFLYVLVDEHQDSSGAQNEFLKAVWGIVEKPNIFVVGDDRQLIYGFGGASLEYFENFKHTFGKAKLITLVENYRSTQKILDSSHALLESVITKEKLKSKSKVSHAMRLVEAYYPRDEIICAGMEIREKIKNGIDPNEIAVLLPKNRQVRSAIAILKDMGIPVAGGWMIDFFDLPETTALIRVLKILAHPDDGQVLAESIFDKHSMIPPIRSHEFIKANNMREFSLLNLKDTSTLFPSEVNAWLGKLKTWLAFSSQPIYSLIQKIGAEFLLDTATNHGDLISRIEVIRTMLHLALSRIEKNPKLTLGDFLDFLGRMEIYGEDIPLAVFSPDDGVKVLTLHGSKGLEFDYVWIGHMDQKSFFSRHYGGFALPESFDERIEKRNMEVLKRELYVAITRAKRFCVISFSLFSYTGSDQELAHIVSDISSDFEKQSAKETEKNILKNDPRAYVAGPGKNEKNKEKHTSLDDLKKIVAQDYESRKVSVSLLNNFFECPWKWYFRSLLQLPGLKTESLEFGDKVHKAIDKILKLKKVILPEEKEVAKVVSFWVKNRLKEITEDRENEQPVSFTDKRFPHLSIYGRIDLIEKLGGKNVRVTDFKTGSPKKKIDIEKRDDEGRLSNLARQLAMYTYLLSGTPKWGKVKVAESRLEYLEAKDPKEMIYTHAVTSEEIELLIKDIYDYDELVKKGEWVNRSCRYNSYGKVTECEYCKMAEIYKK